MNEDLQRIVEQVERLAPVVQEVIVREFQRVVTVANAVAPENRPPSDERFERCTLRARTVLRLASPREKPGASSSPPSGPSTCSSS